VIVTHDQEEAMEVADRIVVMNEGHVEQIGSPSEIYDEPATPFVMRFVGEVNVLPRFDGADGHRQGDAGEVYVRPHDLDLLDEPQERSLPVVLRRLVHLGREVVAAMIRRGTDWISNVAQGAQCEAVCADGDLARLAVDAAAALDMDYAGVDLIRDRDGRLLVVEVNGIPAWRGLQSVCGFDVAERLVDRLLGQRLAAGCVP
jgi:ABC-type Fe3+/spermidine/putrescine transport system ATPase subunit